MAGIALLLILMVLTAPFAVICTLVYIFSKKKSWGITALAFSVLSIFSACTGAIGSNETTRQFYFDLLIYTGVACLMLVLIVLYVRRPQK